jgi:hypothetical protein
MAATVARAASVEAAAVLTFAARNVMASGWVAPTFLQESANTDDVAVLN